ncbi:hypothetical protein [Acidiphilium sp.]|uniref:hypothetical protein n=1 Tax=Acidiphilium sp. TaxID=527 RepID=UPI003CFC5256
MTALASARSHRVGAGLPIVLATLSLLAGCTLPQAGGVGTANLNPAVLGPLYYRYIPSAAHQIGPDLPFPGPNYAQQQQIVSVAGFNGGETEKGVGNFVDNFYAGGFPAVHASLQRCYQISAHYFRDEYGFNVGQLVPCLAEDDAAYIYNRMLVHNWGFASSPYFTNEEHAARTINAFAIAHQNAASVIEINNELAHDMFILLPTEIELPLVANRP